MFGKRLSDITPEDVRRLITETVPESGDIEFKAELPAKTGQDPWYKDQTKVGDKARNEILEELVGFANAYGGTVVVGMEETRTKPPRAKTIRLIPSCHDLAERFRLFARDCIDPQIPIVEITGIDTNEDGSGVLLLRTAQSPMAPHRLIPTKECYVRRADRTETMTMREIQDLAISARERLSLVEVKLGRAREQFAEMASQYPGYIGLRVAAVPTTELHIDHVHSVSEAKPPRQEIRVKIGDGTNIATNFPFTGSWEPMLHGSKIENDRNGALARWQVKNDGFIEFAYLNHRDDVKDSKIFPSWLAFAIGNVIIGVERFRLAASAPAAEFAIEIEVSCEPDDARISYYASGGCETLGPMPRGTHRSVRTIAERETFNETVRLLERDFWNAAGLDFSNALWIDFNSALGKE